MGMTRKQFEEYVLDDLADAELVAYDGCHKIYLALDEIEAEWFRNEYPFVCDGTYSAMADKLWDWWQESCTLRFVQGVRHNPDDPNAGFTSIIPQFAEEDTYHDDDEGEWGR